MITTVADLLNEFKKKEEEVLAGYGRIKHPVLIGSMYEGLTKEILSKAVFENLNLRVVAGKIKNSLDELSGEIDCMLVVGSGEQIPYTDKYIYDSDKVVAVIQVKKSLYSKDVKDSYENLKSVIDVTETRDGEDYHGRLTRDAYRSIVMKDLPDREELDSLPLHENLLYHILLLEAFYPVRIVWGYNGFKSHKHFRDSFADYLESNISSSLDKIISGYGPLNFPNLIMCENYSLIKCNGMPFSFALENGWWNVMVSSNRNPVYFFLEVIWTRLQYMFKLSSDIFGEDLNVDQVFFYLGCRPVEKEGRSGWEYFYLPIPDKKLEEVLDVKDWEPVELNKAQFIIINSLCYFKKEIPYIDNDELTMVLAKEGIDNLEAFVSELCSTGLVYLKAGKIGLLIDSCGIAAIGGKLYAGENKTGRFSRWVTKNSQKLQGK